MIKAALQSTIFDDIIEAMRSNRPWAAPAGKFYLLDGVVAPSRPRPTILRIETDQLNVPITIEVVGFQENGAGVDPRSKPKVISTVAQGPIKTVPVQLTPGQNRILVRIPSSGDSSLLIVNTSTIITTFEAFARVYFQEVKRIIDEQQRAITSQLATRLLEPFLAFRDLLPDVQSLQILGTRLAARGLIHEVATNIGVEDLTKALTLTTPVYRPMDKDTDAIEPSLDPWVNTASQFSGLEAHCWIPNVGIASWLAFLHYVANQPDLFRIIDVREDEIVIETQGEIQRHRFDFDAFGTDFLTALARQDCFKSVRISITMDSIHLIRICAATYPFDLFITEESPIGNCRLGLDIGTPFDSGCSFDSDDEDPFSDGWVGLPLSGRFEQDFPIERCLDTMVMPAFTWAGEDCCYESFFTQVVANQRYDIELPEDITMSGFVQTAIPWTLESPDSTRWDITLDATGQLVAISGSTRLPDDFKVTKPDSSEAAFAITNAGNLQVVAPPPGGETLNDTIFVKAVDATVWHVTVNNANVIVTTRIF